MCWPRWTGAALRCHDIAGSHFSSPRSPDDRRRHDTYVCWLRRTGCRPMWVGVWLSMRLPMLMPCHDGHAMPGDD